MAKTRRSFRLFSRRPSPEQSFSLPKSWWVFISSLAVAGGLLFLFPVPIPRPLASILWQVRSEKFHLFLAILVVSIPFSHVVNLGFSRLLSRLFELRSWATRENLYPPAILGLFEAIIYPSLFIVNKPEFIGAWLALKVAGGWKNWQGGNEPRRRFFKFLLGNVVTILIGYATYVSILAFVWNH